MLIGIGASIYSGNRYDAAISSANLAARFDAWSGITSSGGFASAWADQSGNGRNLLQAMGANQPIHLPFAGAKYGYLSGDAGNYFSTPDSVANSITGDIDIRWYGSSDDWTSALGKDLVGKWVAAGNQRSFAFQIAGGANTGCLTLTISTNGIATSAAISTAAVGFSDSATGWVRVTRASATGNCNFYTSTNGTDWTLLGTANIASTSGALFDSTASIQVGEIDSSGPLLGKAYRAQIYNGIDGTLAVDFDPSRWTSGTTFTAATGETWTINSTGSKPAQIVDRPSLLFDGAAHCMKTAAFTLNQPTTVYLVAKQVSWSSGDYFTDGNAGNTGVIAQQSGGVSPNIQLYAGASGVTGVGGMAVGTTAVLTAVFNGASSSLRVNNGAATTGDAGAGNMGGFTFGGNAAGSALVNAQAYEMMIYNVAHDAATSANIRRALMSKHGVA